MPRTDTPDPGPDPSLAAPFRLLLAAIGAALAVLAVVNLLSGKIATGSVAVVLATLTTLAGVIAERIGFRVAAAAVFYALALGLFAFQLAGYGMRDYAIAGYPAILFAGCVFLGANAYWGLAALMMAGAAALGGAEHFGLFRNELSDHVDLRTTFNFVLLIAASAAGGRILMKAIRAAAMRERALTGALQDSEDTVRRFFRSSQSAISVSRLDDGTYLEVNDAYLAMFGRRRDEVVGRTSLDVGIWEDSRDRERLVQALRDRRVVKDFETRFRKGSGEVMECLLAAEVLEIGGHPCLLSSVTDVTAARAAEQRAEFLSTRDSLTGLPNRVLGLDRLDHDIERASRDCTVVAVLHLGIDRFKTVNESLGYAPGDAVLREACQRIAARLGKGDSLARIGGDEFLVIGTTMHEVAEVDRYVEAVMGAFDAPFRVEGHELRFTCSAGVAVFPQDSVEAETLLRQAESAMHFAKVEGRGRYYRFDRVIGERVRDRLFVETRLRQSIERRELHLVFQPKFDMATRGICGLEALCRWTHPELGSVSPARFIAIAEESALIHELGLWVLRESCGQIARWRREGVRAVPIAVNLSAQQLTLALPDIVSGCVREAGVEPRDVEFEVTESMLITSQEATRKVLEQVAGRGSRIVLDDFGVGYSSLNYIKHLHLDGLKIDRSFVREIETSRHDAAIVTAIVTLAHGLGLRVVAEGIESGAQLEALRGLGCDEGQGYFLSTPMKGEEIAARFLEAGAPAR
ncbi:MAG: putative bifunctional diguanylate cyclase/phosphodiesterase [Burkholderiales bacterium]